MRFWSLFYHLPPNLDAIALPDGAHFFSCSLPYGILPKYIHWKEKNGSYVETPLNDLIDMIDPLAAVNIKMD
jgi:hypothetical protein